MAVLSPTQVDVRLRQLSFWAREGDSIGRTFTFRRFMESVAFVNDVARLAERYDHHPDIDIRYKQVTLRFTTWEEGGITERDFEMAGRIDRLSRNEEDEEEGGDDETGLGNRGRGGPEVED
ncbi:MAG: 4a-hydroxytetrahydrobiopterin dehydratase [Thermoplasmatota archaeon]